MIFTDINNILYREMGTKTYGVTNSGNNTTAAERLRKKPSASLSVIIKYIGNSWQDILLHLITSFSGFSLIKFPLDITRHTITRLKN